MTDTSPLELGAWIGRAQAFAILAVKSSGAQAEALRHIRDTEAYTLVGLSWNEFCPKYTGLTRTRVDEIIQNLNEFGQAYFRLSEIASLSPETYRQLASQIDGDAIEIDGQLVPIVPENAARIRDAVRTLRARLREAAAQAGPIQRSFANIRGRLDSAFHQIERLGRSVSTAEQRQEMEDLLNYSISRLVQILGNPRQE